MKVALFHELHKGGALRAVNLYVKELRKNHSVTVYSTESFQPKVWSGNNWKIRLYKDTIELWKLSLLHRKIAGVIDSCKYDVVFVHPSQFTQAPFILRYLTTKKIYYCQEPLRIAYDDQIKRTKKLSLLKNLYDMLNLAIRKDIDKRNILSADSILTNSHFTQGNIASAYGLTSNVSYLGVDTEFFHPMKVPKKYDLLYIGSRDDIEGYPLLMKILSMLKEKPKTKMHIIGEDWIEDEKSFRNLYLQAKMVICFSRNEPFGLIPLEAMACGVPVIALNEGGYRETIVNRKTGFLVNRNASEIAEIIHYLINNKDRVNLLGRNARKHMIKSWSMEKTMINCTENFNAE